MSVRVLPARDDALLVELDDLAAALALHASLRADPVPGVGQPVPGARTLLVPFDPWRVAPERLAVVLRSRVLPAEPVEPRLSTLRQAQDDAGSTSDLDRLVEIPTVYDGEDLADVARLLGWSPQEVVRRHTAASWVVGFVGFAPGFAYLTGDDDGLVVPRRESPRTRVPAGSVALAGPYSGVYPRASPGGWQLVGRTDVVTWDPDREPPTPWAPGNRVRFTAVRESARGTGASHRGSSGSERQSELPTRAGAAAPTTSATGLEVVTPGLQALVQDLGRPGLAHLGVAASGAADPRSLRAANRGVGNPAGTAAIEAAGGGLRLRARGDVVVALAGADGPAVVRTGGDPDDARHAPRARPFRLRDGDELELGAPARGWRTYVAVRGGLDVPPALGSRATDALAHLGPAALSPGVVLGRDRTRGPVLDARRGRTPAHGTQAVATDDVGAPDPAALPAPGKVTTLPVVLGPHDDWFTPDAVALLAGQEWRVTDRSDRVGLRLAGPRPLDRTDAARGRELPSEGCVTGALQVPPDGLPVLFGVDHPLTGGYPVVGAVPSSHTWLLGQLPPGALLRFAPAPPGRPHHPFG
ncbi:sensor histidine kinase inhibitor, KipI family [Krasilnikoviella flava]|uniref:Sensor histidine kinase inhibitor, KipI family n=2 Tax=Krasilnikoviella flava TaxID=526729 RepID=A0A1T5M0U0_9MICO|nr:sensor histidine kinase inhibitor, KipI family [Krasilnikoviella flava]